MSGFYYVLDSKGNTWECILRGKHHLKKDDIIPGDKVVFSSLEENSGVIEKILDRKNRLYRPRIVNVDQVVIVSALSNPQPDLNLLDRLLVIAEKEYLSPLLVFNKEDLNTDNTQLIETYKNLGYRVIVTSAKKGKGIAELKEELKNKLSVFAGASGAGKSSILNYIFPEKNLETGDISPKLKRGKHTTKHVKLLVLDKNSFVADTPGFSKLHLPKGLTREELGSLFPEFASRQHECKFSSCLHNKEPQCAIKNAVSSNEIAEWRYNNYLQFLEEVINMERSYYNA